MKWIVFWIAPQYQHTWETFDHEWQARIFISMNKPNVVALWRGEMMEEFGEA